MIIGIYPVDGQREVHLLELEVDAPPSNIDLTEFAQEEPSERRSNWQVAYDERYLSPDGESVIGSAFAVPTDTGGSTRLVFFLHSVDFNRPLLTPFGPVALPDPVPMPERLRNIIGYEAPD